jgi:hypothetical protein
MTPSLVDAEVATLAKADSPFAAACGVASLSSISPSPTVPSSLMRAYSPLFLFDECVDQRICKYVTNSSHQQLLIVGIPSDPVELESLLIAIFDPRRDLHFLVETHEIESVCNAIEQICRHLEMLSGSPLYSVAASADEYIKNAISIQIVEVDRALAPSACQLLLDLVSFRKLPWEDIPTGTADSPYNFQVLGDPVLCAARWRIYLIQRHGRNWSRNM